MADLQFNMEGILNWLQSPEVRGLSQGLLAHAGPSMTQPASWSKGLSAGLLRGQELKKEAEQQKETERHNKQTEEYHKILAEIQKMKQEQERKQSQQVAEMLGLADSAPQMGTQSPLQSGLSQATETLQSTGKPILHNKDGSISTENSITVQHPQLNQGRYTNIPSIVNGQQLDEPGAISAALQDIASGKSYQGFDSLEEAVSAAKARSEQLGQQWQQQQAQQQQPQGGILAQPMASNVPPGTMMPPPNAPMIPQLPRNQARPISPENLERARALFAAGDITGAMKAARPEPTTLEQEAAAIFGDINSPEAKEWMKNVRLKPVAETTVNMGETYGEMSAKERAKRDNEIIKESKARQEASKKARNIANEAYHVVERLRKNGIEPFLYDPIGGDYLNQLRARVGSHKAQNNLKDLQLLSSYLTTLQLEKTQGMPARAINQYEEKQIAKALGNPKDSLLTTTQKLMLDASRESVSGMFKGDFEEAYKDLNTNLSGVNDAYEAWLETDPDLKFDESGNFKGFASNAELRKSWKEFVPGSKENLTKLRKLERKDEAELTDEDLEFIVLFGGR